MSDDGRPGATHEVIVIGAGIAGLTAARRSQQLGANVALIEKGTENDANTTRRSGGSFHAAYLDPLTRRPDELYATIIQATDGHARPDVARAWADNVRRALQFLISEGGVFEKTGENEDNWNVNGPPPKVVEELAEVEPKWRGAANDRLLSRMTQSFIQHGGTYRPGTRAVALKTEGGVVVGVDVEPRAGGRRELVRGRAVIMADGGFQSNPQLVAQYVTRHTYSILCSNLSTGDCLQMAMEVGAKAVELEAAYQMVMLRDRVTHPRVHHPPTPTSIMYAAMVINGNGERIGDEALQAPPKVGGGAWYPNDKYADKRLSGLMAKTDAPGDSWVVFDDAVWETAGRKAAQFDASLPQAAHPSQTPLNPTIIEQGGTFLSANSIVELAGQATLPADRLQKSVDAFNRFCRDGTPLDPPRSARAQPIVQPPFHAIPLVPGIFFTQGGVLVNGHGQALDQQDQPIAGLYAAGGTMGGLMGGPHQGYAGGWSEATTFGLLSAEHAVSRVGAPAEARRG